MKPQPRHFVISIFTIVTVFVATAAVARLADIGHGRLQPADIQRVVQDSVGDDNTTVIVQVANGIAIKQTAAATSTPSAPSTPNNALLALTTLLFCLIMLAVGAIAIRLPDWPFNQD